MNFLYRIKAIVFRELRLMRQSQIQLLATVGVMAFCCIFFLTLFRDGFPKDLPTGIVDSDNSSLSRNIIRQIDATELGETIGFDTYTQARKALQTGEINAFLVIPEGFYEDVLSGRQPVLTFYVNSLYFVGGALAYKNVLSMVNLSSGAVQREMLRAKGMSEAQITGTIQPIAIDAHQIGNTTTDYGIYLVNVLIPGMLEAIIILVTVYALGSELKNGTGKHLLEKAGGSMTVAMTGKLIPYTVLFTVTGITCDLILYGWAGFPLAGSLWNIILGTFLMVLACESVAFFIIGTLPILRLAISISALYSILGFSMAGFTFPVEAMHPAVQGLAAIFPLRHYYMIYVQEAIFAGGFGGWHTHAVCLMLFMLLPPLVSDRLKKAYIFRNYPRK